MSRRKTIDDYRRENRELRKRIRELEPKPLGIYCPVCEGTNALEWLDVMNCRSCKSKWIPGKPDSLIPGPGWTKSRRGWRQVGVYEG